MNRAWFCSWLRGKVSESNSRRRYIMTEDQNPYESPPSPATEPAESIATARNHCPVCDLEQNLWSMVNHPPGIQCANCNSNLTLRVPGAASILFGLAAIPMITPFLIFRDPNLMQLASAGGALTTVGALVFLSFYVPWRFGAVTRNG